ncbi:MAG: hypothetical protein ACRC7V_06920 [Lachnospiraceae bacterium]
MKKKILCLVLLITCVLSACKGSEQDTTNSNDTNQIAYTEILNAYSVALNEKWDGNAIMEQGLNLTTIDLYDGVPLDNIGYAIMDLDGNGTDELIIGTTTSVTDDFYSKLILDLYTLDQDNASIQVFSSTVRDRYFNAGEQLFVNFGSNSAENNTNTTLHYEGGVLSETDKITAMENYVQMDLTPLSQWMKENK